MMPQSFFLIGYAGLVWNRELLAFVPACVLRGVSQDDAKSKYWFLNNDECLGQAEELKSLGIQAEMQNYTLKQVDE